MAKLKSHVRVAAFPKGKGVLAVNALELDLAWPAAIGMAGISATRKCSTIAGSIVRTHWTEQIVLSKAIVCSLS